MALAAMLLEMTRSLELLAAVVAVTLQALVETQELVEMVPVVLVEAPLSVEMVVLELLAELDSFV